MNLDIQPKTVSYKRSLVIGCLLGNGIARVKKSDTGALYGQIRLRERLNQRAYLEWKAAEIARTYNLTPDINIQAEYISATFQQSGRLRVLSEWFYQHTTKVVTEKIRFMDHPVGLAVMVADTGTVLRRQSRHKDGTVYRKSPRIRLRPQYDSLESFERLQHSISVHTKADSTIKRDSRGRYELDFTHEASQMVWAYIQPWIPENILFSMSWQMS